MAPLKTDHILSLESSMTSLKLLTTRKSISASLLLVFLNTMSGGTEPLNVARYAYIICELEKRGRQGKILTYIHL